jgi:hypothetical protein
MSTKLKGDFAEQAAVFHAMKHGYAVLRPLGDRLPYDLVFEVNGQLARIQVKCAWFNKSAKNYVVDVRRTKTNRRIMKREMYKDKDFDFALAYIPDHDLFYVFPVEVFIKYAGEIHMVESNKRQRKPKSAEYRDAWHLFAQWAVRSETTG